MLCYEENLKEVNSLILYIKLILKESLIYKKLGQLGRQLGQTKSKLGHSDGQLGQINHKLGHLHS
ncbi:hypothetical protein TMU01_29560 [Tenuibacillus multivorans]|nr:hypothetical protein TMU01_29560 [Tenuibacillus multivorans]